MRFSRALTAACLGVALCCAAAAQSPRSVLGYVGSTSFWVDMPDGWQADQATAKRLGAIFILLPGDSTFRSAPSLVIASVFHSVSVDAAMAKDKASFLARDPDIAVTDEYSHHRYSGTAILGARVQRRQATQPSLRNSGLCGPGLECSSTYLQCADGAPVSG